MNVTDKKHQRKKQIDKEGKERNSQYFHLTFLKAECKQNGFNVQNILHYLEQCHLSEQSYPGHSHISLRTEQSLSLCHGNYGSALTDIIVRTRRVIIVQGRPSHHVINHLLLWGFKEMNGSMYTKVKKEE